MHYPTKYSPVYADWLACGVGNNTPSQRFLVRKEYMNKLRLFLPFTHGVDARALTSVLAFAKAVQATLVAAALIPLSQSESFKGTRLERIQQAKDFLELVHTKANFSHVTLEQREVYTHDVVEQITADAQRMNCQGILLMFCGQRACLVSTGEAKRVQSIAPLPLYILSYPSSKSSCSDLIKLEII